MKEKLENFLLATVGLAWIAFVGLVYAIVAWLLATRWIFAV